MHTKPYIVSGDIYLLLSKWVIRKNLVLPEQKFFEDLRKEFCSYMSNLFSNFEFISEKVIVEHMKTTILNSGLPCISLDPVYHSCNFLLELTRTVNTDGSDKGLYHRFGNLPILKQLSCLKSQGFTKVCLVDDVIFSGLLVERVIKLLSRIGIEASVICAGVGIQEGLKKVSGFNREIYCARIYKEVVDEVCERDFYLGVPYSGRSLVSNQNIGLPYILPYGKPDKWASIPPKSQKQFSEFCIQQTIYLFEEIEKISGRIICCSEIERKAPGQPNTGRYVNFLKSIKV